MINAESTTTPTSRPSTRPAHRRAAAAPGGGRGPRRARPRGRRPPVRGVGRRSSTPSRSRPARRRSREVRAAFLAPILARRAPARAGRRPRRRVLGRGDPAETDEALALTGKDVGTPIIHFAPPAGVAFFGPVISRLPAEDDAAAAVGPRGRAGPLSRLRRAQAQPAEPPQLRALGVAPAEIGSRRTGTAAAAGPGSNHPSPPAHAAPSTTAQERDRGLVPSGRRDLDLAGLGSLRHRDRSPSTPSS